MARKTHEDILNTDDYTPLETMDWKPWKACDLKAVVKLWEAGEHIEDIARKVKRKQDEVTILLFDFGRLGIIKRRKGGVLGERA